MNSFINTLSDAVLSKTFQSCSREELEVLSRENPFSPAIQLLYARKLKQLDDAAYGQQLQKTLLYFNNPLFIKYLVETEATGTEVAEDRVVEAHAPQIYSEDHSPVDANRMVLAENSYTHPAEPESASSSLLKGSSLQQAEEEVPVSPEDEGAILIAENESIESGEADDTLPPLPAFTFTPIDPAKAELTFTPYHTIDYFAAQGIKLGDESNSADRFGTQLKSFTSWLKQMKRLPGATAKGNITVTEEKSIEQMAEQSLSGENADTEAMAQVWAKQGNAKKAIEIYKKLSLQIPAKSAYFAAKIDFLKKQT